MNTLDGQKEHAKVVERDVLVVGAAKCAPDLHGQLVVFLR